MSLWRFEPGQRYSDVRPIKQQSHSKSHKTFNKELRTKRSIYEISPLEIFHVNYFSIRIILTYYLWNL